MPLWLSRFSPGENLVDKQLVVIYDGSFDELAKFELIEERFREEKRLHFRLLFSIHQPGVYAVNRKNTPEKNCLWVSGKMSVIRDGVCLSFSQALRVFEENQNKLSSWNIYQKGQVRDDENSRMPFSSSSSFPRLRNILWLEIIRHSRPLSICVSIILTMIFLFNGVRRVD